MDTVFEDLRYALRQLRNSGWFTVSAVAVIALGMGVNVAIFSILNGILLRPLPYADSDRIVSVTGTGSREFCCLSYPNFSLLQNAVGTETQGGMTLRHSEASIAGLGGRFQVDHEVTTSGIFEMLGTQPIKGQIYRDRKHDPNRDRVVLLGEDVWRKVFNSDPTIEGKVLAIAGQTFTILGVMPKGFEFPYGTAMQIWSPEMLTAASEMAMSGNERISGRMFLRLPENMAQTQLADILNRTQTTIAMTLPNGAVPTRIVVEKYQKALTKDVHDPLSLLYLVALGIWALASINVSSLMLARASSRSTEFAIRAALGATRRRLLQQNVVEGLLLSGVGSALGFLVAQCSMQLFWRQIQLSLPLAKSILLDWRLIVCLAVFTLLTTLVVSALPAVRVMRSNVHTELHNGASTSSPDRIRTREVLVVVQLALTLAFLMGAGLFLRTIDALRQVPLGFSADKVLTAGIMLASSPLRGDAAVLSQEDVIRTAYLPLLERIRKVPGVQVAALSSVLPLRTEFDPLISIQIDHKPVPVWQDEGVSARLSSTGLVEALGIPMLRGRFFTLNDSSTSPPVVVVNQAFVNHYMKGLDPLGHTVSAGKGQFADIRIVGVIGDIKQSKVTEATTPEIYFCLEQIGPGKPLYGIAKAFIQVAIRADIPAALLGAQFDHALHTVSPDATTSDVKTIHEALEDSFGNQLLITHLMECFAGLALLVASVGLYGLLSYVVMQRNREIGVRIALGATKSGIIRLVLRRALGLLAGGLSIGAILVWFVVKFASAYIYGVDAHDTPTFAMVVLVLAMASLVAAWIPAHRAASVDPLRALRME